MDPTLSNPEGDFVPKLINVIGHSDGGTRAESCSAAGWVLEAVLETEGVTRHVPIAMCGKYFKEPLSSFLVEAIALEDMITHFCKNIIGVNG